MNRIRICSIPQSHTSYCMPRRMYYWKVTWIQWWILNNFIYLVVLTTYSREARRRWTWGLYCACLAAWQNFPSPCGLPSYLTIFAWRGESIRRCYVGSVCVKSNEWDYWVLQLNAKRPSIINLVLECESWTFTIVSPGDFVACFRLVKVKNLRLRKAHFNSFALVLRKLELVAGCHKQFTHLENFDISKVWNFIIVNWIQRMHEPVFSIIVTFYIWINIYKPETQ